MSESRYQQRSPPAQCVKAVKADGVREGQALQHRSLNSVDRLQTEEGGFSRRSERNATGCGEESVVSRRRHRDSIFIDTESTGTKQTPTSCDAAGTNMASVVAVSAVNTAQRR